MLPFYQGLCNLKSARDGEFDKSGKDFSIRFYVLQYKIYQEHELIADQSLKSVPWNIPKISKTVEVPVKKFLFDDVASWSPATSLKMVYFKDIFSDFSLILSSCLQFIQILQISPLRLPLNRSPCNSPGIVW